MKTNLYSAPNAEIIFEVAETILCNSIASETEHFEDLTTVEW